MAEAEAKVQNATAQSEQCAENIEEERLDRAFCVIVIVDWKVGWGTLC